MRRQTPCQRVRIWALLLFSLSLGYLSDQTTGAWLKPAVAALPDHSVPSWERDLQHTLARAQPYLDHYGYAAIFVAILVEGVGLLAPGQSLLIAGAIMAAHGGLKITWVIGWAFLASLLGPCLGYFLGRLGGRPLLVKMRVNEARLDRLVKVFATYGPGLILIARFVDGLRQFHGLVAGIAAMPWRKFLALAIPGAALWTVTWGLGAYLLDRHAAAWHLSWQGLRPWLFGLTLFLFLAVFLWLRRPGRKAK